MGKTATAIIGGIIGIGMLGLIVSPSGGTALRNFFGGIGYDIGVAGAPVTGRFPTYPAG